MSSSLIYMTLLG